MPRIYLYNFTEFLALAYECANNKTQYHAGATRKEFFFSRRISANRFDFNQ